MQRRQAIGESNLQHNNLNYSGIGNGPSSSVDAYTRARHELDTAIKVRVEELLNTTGESWADHLAKVARISAPLARYQAKVEVEILNSLDPSTFDPGRLDGVIRSWIDNLILPGTGIQSELWWRISGFKRILQDSGFRYDSRFGDLAFIWNYGWEDDRHHLSVPQLLENLNSEQGVIFNGKLTAQEFLVREKFLGWFAMRGIDPQDYGTPTTDLGGNLHTVSPSNNPSGGPSGTKRARD